MERIEIRVIQRPDDDDPEKMLRWFVAVLGLSGDHKDSIAEQILKDFAYAAKEGIDGLSSSELRFEKNIPRSTVIYHLNRFIDSGIIVKKGRKYHLRAGEMSKVIEELEYDIEKEMRRMLDMARDFDRLFTAKSGEVIKLPRMKRQREK